MPEPTPAPDAAPTPVDLDLGAYGTPDGSPPAEPAAPPSETPPATPPADASNWRDGLPEELATDASLADIKDLPALVKSFIHAQRLIGRDKIPMPGEDASTEEWMDVYNRLGRPADADGYTMGPPDELPEGYKYNAAYEAAIRKAFHEAGLRPEQAGPIWDALQAQATGGYKDFMSGQAARLEAEHASLHEEWGEKYDENLQLASWVAKEFGGDDFVKFLNESKIAQEPQFLKVAAAIGAKLGEDTPQPGRASATLTPAEAQSKINEVMGDPKHPYHDGDSVAHKDAVGKMEKLFKMAYPEPVKKGGA